MRLVISSERIRVCVVTAALFVLGLHCHDGFGADCEEVLGVCTGIGICNAYGQCIGAQTYATIGNDVWRGRVTKTFSDGSVSFLPDSSRVPITLAADKIAISEPGNCYELTTRLCVGYGAIFRGPSGRAMSGNIVGYFPISGDAVLQEGSGLFRVPRSSVSSIEAHPVFSSRVSWEAGFEALFSEIGKLGDPSDLCQGQPLLTQMNRQSTTLRELAQRAKSGESLTLADYLSAAAPYSGDINPWKDCLTSSDPTTYGHALRKMPDGQIDPKCLPDTLYSWGDRHKLTQLEQRLGSNRWEESPLDSKSLYLSRTPAASFGYGSAGEGGGYAIRVKLRSGVRFKFLGTDPPDCKKIPQVEARNTVYVRTFYGASAYRKGIFDSAEDFMLCSSGPIDSWSYGTSEFYNELVRDVRYLTDPRTGKDWTSYLTTRNGTEAPYRPALFGIDADQHPFTQNQLLNSFKKLAIMIGDGSAHIYVNPEASTGPSKHFVTGVPTWFNAGDPGAPHR